MQLDLLLDLDLGRKHPCLRHHPKANSVANIDKDIACVIGKRLAFACKTIKLAEQPRFLDLTLDQVLEASIHASSYHCLLFPRNADEGGASRLFPLTH
jgi:hypothetical protein